MLLLVMKVTWLRCRRIIVNIVSLLASAPPAYEVDAANQCARNVRAHTTAELLASDAMLLIITGPACSVKPAVRRRNVLP